MISLHPNKSSGEPSARPEIDGPTGGGFDACPSSWFYLGSIAELARGPIRYELPADRKFVGYLTSDGRPVVLSARCAHMGADLSKGCVRGNSIVCPLHGWEYGVDGQCQRIPSADGGKIPSFARQVSFPVEERCGHVFFFNEAIPRYPMPFFHGVEPKQLRPARAFDLRDDVPWHFIAANGFDLQHFRSAHDRMLVGMPEVDTPHAFARRIKLKFRVAGNSLTDRITRAFAGPEVTMTLSSWCGTLIFVTAEFRRTTSYGLMTVRPLDHGRTHARVIVWVRRSDGLLGRYLMDPINSWVRRWFVHGFLNADIGRMSGMRYDRNRTIGADNCFSEYIDWLQSVHRQ
jgi:nitrite reductase/ring-hydroxylating ferredoxin subunit